MNPCFPQPSKGKTESISFEQKSKVEIVEKQPVELAYHMGQRDLPPSGIHQIGKNEVSTDFVWYMLPCI